MPAPLRSYESCPPERFVVEVFSELGADVVQRRWREVNVVLRLSMLTGLDMQLDAALNLLCDLAGEIVRFDGALVYFWDEAGEQVQVRAARGFPQRPPEPLAG